MEWDCRIRSVLVLLLAARCVSPQPPPSPQPTAAVVERRGAGAGTNSDLAGVVRVEKDGRDSSHLLNIRLPTTNFQHFQQFIARVVDVSPSVDARLRDANRTFVASVSDGSLINIHGLSPGHTYALTVLGRSGDETSVIREESVFMDPLALDFGASSSRVDASETNITMRAVKSERALQDTFRVEYMQLEPPRRYPILDVHDIAEQREVELYLGNLNPGRDYQVTVNSLRANLPSQHPWSGVITTRPLRPTNLSVAELSTPLAQHQDGQNSTTPPDATENCIQLNWLLPSESGADRFKLAYGRLHAGGESEMKRTEVTGSERQLHLCDGVRPGQSYLFTVATEKGNLMSGATSLVHTLRPAPPKELEVEADFHRLKFRVEAKLPPANESASDKCHIAVVSEHLERMEQIVDVIGGNASHSTCAAYLDLVPGRRYEFSAAAMSNGSASTKIFVNKAIEPGFDFNALGLRLDETAYGTGLELHWSDSDVTRGRIKDAWAKIVGNESRLHFNINPISGNGANNLAALSVREAARQMETTPANAGPVGSSQLKQGSCYKIHLYTVTTSGIVSKRRYEQLRRMQLPVVEMSPVGQISRDSAQIRAFLPPKSLHAFGDNGTAMVSDECSFRVEVLESAGESVIANHTVRLRDDPAPSLHLEALRPYNKYEVRASVICGPEVGKLEAATGAGVAACPAKRHSLPIVSFTTKQDKPGAVRNLAARALNSYSTMLTWLPPESPNGLITHYVINVYPVKPTNVNETTVVGGDEVWLPWRINVPAGSLVTAPSRPVTNTADGTQSLLPPLSGNNSVEALVDNLIGGQRYQFTVTAVTEAGAGDLTPIEKAVVAETPLTAPPRPSACPEVLLGSVRPTHFTVQFNVDSLSQRHGLIRKIAFVVAEILPTDGKVRGSDSEPSDSNDSKKSPAGTWFKAHAFDVWPPYVAIELAPDMRSRGPLTLVIGNDATCADKDSSAICNGQLKPASKYHVKLRVYTSPTAWTDTLYSDPVETGETKSDVLTSVRSVFATLLIVLLACVLVIAFGLLYSRGRNKTASSTSDCRLFSCLSKRVSASANSTTGRARFPLQLGFPLGDSNGAPPTHHHNGINGHAHYTSRRNDKQQPRPQTQRHSYYNGYHLNGTSGGQQHFKGHPTNPSGSSNKESQWAALKMIMAERAADCLAKLGLDSHPSSAKDTGTALAASAADNVQQSNNNPSPTTISTNSAEEMDQSPSPCWMTGGNVVVVGSAKEPLRVLGSPTVHFGEEGSDGIGGDYNRAVSPSTSKSAATNGALFNAPHHRRSKSLRERTGVDQRLERLPSGPPPGQKMLLWTVIKGQGSSDKMRPVRLCDVSEHVRLMSADSDFRFSEEYEELRNVGVGQTCIAADLMINRAKNRFTNILPYDHSRVKLPPVDDEDGSDYVNASFIPGFNSRREFIAAQGPLPSTRDQFWRLVWEQQCPAIVALTRCVEKGRDKCHQYWPDSSQRSVVHGDIEVTLLSESSEYEEFVERELRLVNLAEPGQPPRTVLHLHYQAWPDFGVPDHPAGVVNFIRLFRARLPPSPGTRPTIVHCSAGVGRSGTFMAIDRLMQNIHIGKPVDIFGSVHEMRLERCHMVQNEAQYIFIHHALLYALENFYPHLMSTSSSARTSQHASQSSLASCNFTNPPPQSHFPFASKNPNVFFGSSGSSASVVDPQLQQQQKECNGMAVPRIHVNSTQQQHPAHHHHQNAAFTSDDGRELAESGL